MAPRNRGLSFGWRVHFILDLFLGGAFIRFIVRSLLALIFVGLAAAGSACMTIPLGQFSYVGYDVASAQETSGAAERKASSYCGVRVDDNTFRGSADNILGEEGGDALRSMQLRGYHFILFRCFSTKAFVEKGKAP